MNNWQPRVGLAYALNNRTSIRTGYGLFYQLSRATVFGHTGAGFNVNSTSNSSLDSNATLYAKLNNPYPDGMLLPPAAPSATTPSSVLAPERFSAPTAATRSTTPGTSPSSAKWAGNRYSR